MKNRLINGLLFYCFFPKLGISSTRKSALHHYSGTSHMRKPKMSSWCGCLIRKPVVSNGRCSRTGAGGRLREMWSPCTSESASATYKLFNQDHCKEFSTSGAMSKWQCEQCHDEPWPIVSQKHRIRDWESVLVWKQIISSYQVYQGFRHLVSQLVTVARSYHLNWSFSKTKGRESGNSRLQEMVTYNRFELSYFYKKNLIFWKRVMKKSYDRC